MRAGIGYDRIGRMNTVVTSLSDPQVAAVLEAGGIVVARTDTLYGLLARADDEAAVERVYAIKDRDEKKSPIVLVASIDQLFDPISAKLQELCSEKWPGPVSIIVPSNEAPVWVRRQNDSVAYRIPDNDDLRELLAQTGPLIAPSANPEGKEPAMDIEEAKAYFGDTVDVYIDGGRVTEARASQLLRMSKHGTVEQLR